MRIDKTASVGAVTLEYAPPSDAPGTTNSGQSRGSSNDPSSMTHSGKPTGVLNFRREGADASPEIRF